MGRIIVKQPDGKYAVWSTIVDDFIMRDLETIQPYIDLRVREVAQQTECDIREIVAGIDAGGSGYARSAFAYTWDEMIEILAEKDQDSEA
jgi:hypothetical protein